MNCFFMTVITMSMQQVLVWKRALPIHLRVSSGKSHLMVAERHKVALLSLGARAGSPRRRPQPSVPDKHFLRDV